MTQKIDDGNFLLHILWIIDSAQRHFIAYKEAAFFDKPLSKYFLRTNWVCVFNLTHLTSWAGGDNKTVINNTDR